MTGEQITVVTGVVVAVTAIIGLAIPFIMRKLGPGPKERTDVTPAARTEQSDVSGTAVGENRGIAGVHGSGHTVVQGTGNTIQVDAGNASGALDLYRETTALQSKLEDPEFRQHVERANGGDPQSLAEVAFVRRSVERSMTALARQDPSSAEELFDQLLRPLLDELPQAPTDEPVAPTELEENANPARSSGTSNDRTKYVWGGSGDALRKWYLIHRALAYRAAEDPNFAAGVQARRATGADVTEADVLQSQVAEQLTQITSGLPDVAAPDLTRRPILVPKSDWDAGMKQMVDAVGPLVADGQEYATDWWLGLGSTKAVGVRIHKPFIEKYLKGDLGYPIEEAGAAKKGSAEGVA